MDCRTTAGDHFQINCNLSKQIGHRPEDKEEFKQLFCLFKQLCRQELDENGNMTPLAPWDDTGSISVDEWEQLLETVGVQLSQEELRRMVGEIDQDGDKEISFHEFYDKMSTVVQVPHSRSDIEKAFQTFAKDAPDGYIRSDYLREALKKYLAKDSTDA